jgi:hypothetical protein
MTVRDIQYVLCTKCYTQVPAVLRGILFFSRDDDDDVLCRLWVRRDETWRCVSSVIIFVRFFFLRLYFPRLPNFSGVFFRIYFDALFLVFQMKWEREGVFVCIVILIFLLVFLLLILQLQTMECVCFFFFPFPFFFCFVFQGGLPPSLYGTFLSVVFGTPPASSHAWKHPIIIPMYYWK